MHRRTEMKVKIKTQSGFMIGDAFNIGDDDTIQFRSLNRLQSAPLKDIIEIWPNKGEYSEPQKNLLENSRWKKIPKSKINLSG